MTTGCGTIGVIGLGAMGLGMARWLLRRGLRRARLRRAARGRRAPWPPTGATAAASPAAAARALALLLVMVVNAAQAEAVLFGPDGRCPGAGAGRGRGALLHRAGRRMRARWRSRSPRPGRLLLDAPVSGGTVGAEGGKLTFMASGAPAAFAKAEAALAAMAGKVYRLGDEPGIGSTVKAVNQLLAGVHIATAAEAMAFGVRAGADPRTLFEVISNSAGNSWMFGNRVPHMLDGRLHAALGGRHLRQGSGPGARRRPRAALSAAAGGRGAPAVPDGGGGRASAARTMPPWSRCSSGWPGSASGGAK